MLVIVTYNEKFGFKNAPTKKNIVFGIHLYLRMDIKFTISGNSYAKVQLFRKPQKFGAIVLKVLTLLSNVKTLRTIAPNICGLLRKAEFYLFVAFLS